MTSLTIDITETTLNLDKVFQVNKQKRGYFCKNENKGKREGASFLLLDLHNSFTQGGSMLLLMVGKFEQETSTKLMTLLILRIPAKIQKYQIGCPAKYYI